jgi:hypothetical protein
MTTEHRNIPDAECHEAKGIGSASTADAGKVITPSGSTGGQGELRHLEAQEVNYDNSASGLTADDVKDALDELADRDELESQSDVTDVTTTPAGDSANAGSADLADVNAAIAALEGKINELLATLRSANVLV